MRLLDISITKSGVMLGAWKMEMTVDTPLGPMKSTTHFDDMGGFLTAVSETSTFFAVRLGRIKSSEANARLVTKPLAENPDGAIR